MTTVFDQLTVSKNSVVVDRRQNAVGGDVPTFNWTTPLLWCIFFNVADCHDCDLSPVVTGSWGKGRGEHATRYPFYADQLTDLVGPDVRTHMH